MPCITKTFIILSTVAGSIGRQASQGLNELTKQVSPPPLEVNLEEWRMLVWERAGAWNGIGYDELILLASVLQTVHLVPYK